MCISSYHDARSIHRNDQNSCNFLELGGKVVDKFINICKIQNLMIAFITFYITIQNMYITYQTIQTLL